MTVKIKKKFDRVSPGFDRVDRVPSRTARSTGFSRANSRAGFCLHPNRSQARVGQVPGRPAGPGFKTLVEPEHCKEKTDSSPVLSFSHVMTNQWKVNHNS